MIEGSRPKASALRCFGRSVVQVTALGFGAAAIGNLYRAVSDEAAADTIASAVGLGIGYFDTAPHYGFGLSESRMGIGLKDVPSPVTISTKVGRVLRPLDSVDAVGERHGFVDAQPFEPVFDYSYDGILRSFDESLARLGRERIEIIYVHDLGRITHGDAHDDRFRQFFEGGYRALERLKSEGRIEAIGIGANEWQVCEDALAQADFDGFLLAGRYTLLEQSALDSFLPLCAARGCSVVLGGPFNSGILARGIGDREPTTFNYQPAPPEVLAKVERIQRVCEAHGVPLKAAALQFGGHHPQVVSTIPGLGDVRQVQEAVEFTSLPIPKSLWSDLKNEGLLREDAPTDEGVWL